MPIKPGPWQADIESAFTDPDVQEAVDQLIRERVQPRMTQLEQQLAGARDAQNLWDQIHQDPVGTFNALRDELVAAGYPLSEAQSAAAAAVQEGQASPPPAAAPATTAAAAQEDPRVAEMYAYWQSQREMEQYDATVAQIVNDPANADINPNRYHTYVAAADGDFEKALSMYRSDVLQILADYGIDPEQATAQQQEAASALAAGQAAPQSGAPPVMGNGTGAGAGAPIPTQPDYVAEGISPQDALHKAIEDAAKASLGTGTPPPVS